MNNINLIGRLTKHPELRTTESQKNVCDFTIAVNRIGTDKADFINCVVWNAQAENLCKYQTKGNLIGVNGSLRIDTYEVEGQNRYKTYVLANNIEYLSSKSNDETIEDEFDSSLSKEDVQTLIDDDELPF
jgi:single-strand DNA-binding protein